jgi:hypothetical protein
LLAGAVQTQNLLQNGSFDSPDVAFGNSTGLPRQRSHCCGSPSVGQQHVEPDSDCNSDIEQNVATQAGAHYMPEPGRTAQRLAGVFLLAVLDRSSHAGVRPG